PVTVVVSDVGGPAANMTDSTDVSCFGLTDGDATVLGTGGVPPYVYLWDDPATQSTPTATGLCKGSYSVIIVDNVGDSKQTMVTISQCGVVGTSDLMEKNIVSVYPNPASSFVRFTIDNNESDNTVFQMYDAYGRKVRGDHKIQGSNFMIHRQELPSGIYHIRFISNDGVYTTKLIFQ
ncbi:MAG: T9SS type A sorting domain-containing protein, partial [Flavobacteriales bacterium]|nr:T9SS type A sorting domain-containing protein [Flavobacteriales bacterium]